ncbi:protein EXORDIUM-like 1 [Phalaenopsis equestris]|uniref:protein EXORDIUM-like 1 n=1 Tax=Phalaenopsis equestris TaxID=78828 RepID=UPI0009E27FD4|nr:protein EXORDIUM-like 1 [Phalaenopsis equestris]
MDSSSHSAHLCFFLLSALLFPSSLAARMLQVELEKEPLTITYHKGALLYGPISVNLIWYGNFNASQRSIVSDFVASLSSGDPLNNKPSMSSWWAMAEKYCVQSKKALPRLTLGDQIIDENYSLGKSLKNLDIVALATKGRHQHAINVVLTSDDVTIEGFCMSRCATHRSSPLSKAGLFAYIWVSNSMLQCPGQCSRPFHQPDYGPQAPPFVAPNGVVGVDSIVMNLASTIFRALTFPFDGGGFFIGPKTALLEAATACTAIYGKRAYAGYAGELLVDSVTGASYNASGANGRKSLLPAIFDPSTASCSSLL